MRLGKILAVRSFALKKVRYRVKPEAVDAELAPKVKDPEDFLPDERIIIVQVWLMVEESVPVILLRLGIPCPVRVLEILENDPDVFILIRVIAPNVKIPLRRTLGCFSRALKPWMLIGGVVDDKFCNDLEIPCMGFLQQLLELGQIAIGGVN